MWRSFLCPCRYGVNAGLGEWWEGVFGLPFSPDELEEDELSDYFPDETTLQQWKDGIRAPWPPKPALRFDVGDRVECRVGPHPVKGWAPGRIIKLKYSEPNWPPNMVAPVPSSSP